MKNEIQIKKQIERLEAQKMEIEGAIVVLKNKIKYNPEGQGIERTFGAEYATEWLDSDIDDNVFEKPDSIFG